MGSNQYGDLLKLFNKCGLDLIDASTSALNTLEVDQRKFQVNLQKYINEKKHLLPNLIEQIKNYLDDDDNFVMSLLPCKNANDSVSSHSSFQDNVLKLLLELDELQNELFDYLIEKTVSICETSDDLSAVRDILNMKVNLLTYTINQFRYQPKIVDPESLCKKLIDLIKMVSSSFVKKELISCFPDILSDSSHDCVSSVLEELLDDLELLNTTLDTLSNLKFKAGNTMSIVEKLFDKYEIIDQADFAALCKFIIKASVSLNSKDLLNRLRLKLSFEDVESEKARFMIFDTIREFFQISNSLTELYLGLINQLLLDNQTKANETNVQLKPFDIIAFSVLYTMTQQFKNVDKIFKQLLKCLSLSSLKRLFILTFKLGDSLMRELFVPLCTIAKSLILNANDTLSYTAKIIYVTAFRSMDNKYKQHVIGLLIEFVKHSNDLARDNSLDILTDLCKICPSSIALFSRQIRTLIDVIEYLNMNQIRKIYFIMCTIAYKNPNKENQIQNLQDDLNILIKKQLCSNFLKFKQIGVIGALMTIKNMSSSTNKSIGSSSGSSDDETSESSSSNSTDEYSNDIKNIWQMIIDSSKTSPESLGLFEDDLSSLLSKNSLSKDIETLIKSLVQEMIQKLFVINKNALNTINEFKSSKMFTFKVDYDFGLDMKSSGALNLMSLILNEYQRKNLRQLTDSQAAFRGSQSIDISPITISSTIRLIIALERNNVNDLIDYLSLPVLSIKKSELFKLAGYLGGEQAQYDDSFSKFKTTLKDSEKKIICDTLFYLVNWFIELTNGFSKCLIVDENRETISNLVLTRFITSLLLQQVIIKILPHMNYYKPPMAVFGLVDSNEIPFAHTIIKRKMAKKPGGGNSKNKRKSKTSNKKTGKTKAPLKKRNLNTSNPDASIDPDMIDETDVYADEKELVESSESEPDVVNELRDDEESVEIDWNKLSLFFRDFDLDILNFVRLDLDFDAKYSADQLFGALVKYCSDSSSSSCNAKPMLSPHLLNFILNDVNKKIESLFKSDSSATKAPSAFSSVLQQSKCQTKGQLFLELNPTSASEFAKHVLNNLIDHMLNHLEKIRVHFKKIQSDNDDIKDPVEIINNPNNINLFKVLNQILIFVRLLFSWIEKSDSESNNKLMSETIRKIAKLALKSSTERTASDDEIYCFNFFFRLKDIVVDLNTANNLVKVLDLLANKLLGKYAASSNFDALRLGIIKSLKAGCIEFLQNDYNQNFSGIFSTKQLNNESIVNILNTLTTISGEESIEFMAMLCKLINTDDFMANRDNVGEFSTLKSYFVPYFKLMIEKSVSSLKLIGKYGIDQTSEALERIKKMVYIHTTLVLLKRRGPKSFKDINILTVLKNSKLFLIAFQKYAMPVLDRAFDLSKKEIVDILSKIKESTNYMQEYCLEQESLPVLKQTPIYMRCVEAFLLRIKQLFYVNRCDDAITVDLFSNNLTHGKKKAAKTNKNNKNQTKNKQTKRQEANENEEEDDEIVEPDEDGDEEEEEEDVEDESD